MTDQERGLGDLQRSPSTRGRENMKVIGRVLMALIAALGALFVSTGTAHAGLDNELTLVDGQGDTMDIQQWDTFLNGVFPLDRNRLTRERFHSGRARYHVTGPDSSGFARALAVGDAVTSSHPTPNITRHKTNISANPEWWVPTPPLFPGVSFTADLGNGPGI